VDGVRGKVEQEMKPKAESKRLKASRIEDG
jgi:hypothetical protein